MERYHFREDLNGRKWSASSGKYHPLAKIFPFKWKISAKSISCLAFVTVTFALVVDIACAEATHHGSTDANEAVIYVQIPSWKNRTAYPRFIYYRDYLRRRVKADSNFATDAASLSNLNSQSQTSQSAIIDDNPLSNRQLIKKDVAPTAPSDSGEEVSPSISEYEDFDDEGLIQRYVKYAAEEHSKQAISSNAKDSTEQSESEDPEKPIKFPRDKTNPFNRLQINKEDDSPTTTGKITDATEVNPTDPTSKELINSLEIGNRQNFPVKPTPTVGSLNGVANDEIDSLHLLKDAVPTFDLTMKIIELSKWKDENVIFSPLSIATVLSMILLGSRGETFDELSALLDKHHHLNGSSDWDIQRYHEAFKKLNHYFKVSSGKGVDFSTASEIFVDKQFKLHGKYRRDLQLYYQSNAVSFNFGTDGEIFKQRINRWVREKTHNQIRSILEEAPSKETVLGIVNAIYFKGPWEFPFEDRLTALQEFHVTPKEKLKVQTMFNEVEVPYVDKELFRMTTLPYRDNKTALFLILPKGNDGINDLKNVEKILTKQLLNESIYEMDDTKVAIFLPKLKFSSDGQMSTILENMGLSSLFSAGRANLSGMSDTKNLYLTSVVHRAAVEINEKGTEASAVTLGLADKIFSPPIPFICNKPFIFFIYHVEADTIIFWGRVTRPDNLPMT